ncbi:MAG: hypothetical protein HYR92_02400 [Burkholderiales bacterium]|nr:hypothetical protein [Burkholderiales bacterium]
MSMFLHTKKILSLSSVALVTALSIASAQAQSAPPAPTNPPPGLKQQNQPEPPGRVARVGYAYGNISFADAGSNIWTNLLPNRPISTGDSIMVPELGKAELQVGANALRVNANTRLSFINLDDENIQINLSQGSVVMRVRALHERENIEISTPNLRFVIHAFPAPTSTIRKSLAPRPTIPLINGQLTAIALKKTRFPPAMSLAIWSAINNSMNMATGIPMWNTARSGIRVGFPSAGHLTVTDIEFGSRLGAGLGSIVHLGASRLITMDAGPLSDAVGAGYRGAGNITIAQPMLRHWSLLSAFIAVAFKSG